MNKNKKRKKAIISDTNTSELPQVTVDNLSIGFTGMSNDKAGHLLIRQVMQCLPASMQDEDEYFEAVMMMLRGLKPTDELEGMIVAQMIAVHLISMTMSGRCLLDGQTIDGVNANVNRMTKLMRTFTNQMEALQRYRTKGKQTIQVQHIQINDGGQAVVGNIQGGGGHG